MTLHILCLALFSVGLYCVLRKRNIIKIIIGIAIMGYAVNLFLVLAGYRFQGRSPIYASDQSVTNMVDPLAQSMVLIAIVMGLGVTLLLISLAIRIYERYGTFDITKINKLKG